MVDLTQARRAARRHARRLRRRAVRTARLVREPQRIRPALARRLDPPEPPAPPPAAVRLSRPRRLELITRDLDMSGLGLEIGPSHNPLLRKAEGYDVRIADHLDRAGLIAKYDGVRPTERIEDVDYVLAPGRLTDSIPDTFDYVLASHVAEHTVCLVSFLRDCEALLRPGGRVSLALPDKRFCFDRMRERTSLGRVIDTFRAAPSVHTYGSVIEHNLNMVTKDGAVAWFDGAPGALHFRLPLHIVRERASHAESGEYVDTHNWVLTPHHFRLLVLDLFTLGLTGLRELSFHDTVDHEFFITLAVDAPGPCLSRAELASRSAAELLDAGPVTLA